jgi:hypothetical protein
MIMQIDMHFYATYAIARLAGLNQNAATIVATSAQFVDDATDNNSEKNPNQEMLFAICTAHHLAQSAQISLMHKELHRLVWVPFHFFPAGYGNTLEEKLVCEQDSEMVNLMFANHLETYNKAFYLHLLGIAAHVYMDTFSHYGFAGLCSPINEVDGGSINLRLESDTTRSYITGKAVNFWRKCEAEVTSHIGEKGSRGLGHGAVATYPDRPYLSWDFNYDASGYSRDMHSGERNNQATFWQSLVRLHEKLSKAAAMLAGQDNTSKPIPETEIKSILAFEGEKAERVEKWQAFIRDHLGDGEVTYEGEAWNEQKTQFDTVQAPNHIGDCYRFHQAASYHRWYVLKDLLPEHGVYAV